MNIINRLKSGLGCALVAAVVAVFAAAPASADTGGVPDINACMGQTVKTFVPGIGAKEAAANLGLTVKEAGDLIRELLCGR